MKRTRFSPDVQADVRSIDRENAMRVLTAIHRYAETGRGDVKALEGEFAGLLRLHVGDYRVLFDETGDSIYLHRVRNRREAYR